MKIRCEKWTGAALVITFGALVCFLIGGNVLRQTNSELKLGRPISSGLAWIPWIPFLFFCVNRSLMESRIRAILWLLSSLLAVPLHYVSQTAISTVIGGTISTSGQSHIHNIFSAISIYLLLMPIIAAYAIRKHFQQELMTLKQLESEVAQTSLQDLQSRMDSRYLSTTLQQIAMTMDYDIERADSMTVRFSESLRRSLRSIPDTSEAKRSFPFGSARQWSRSKIVWVILAVWTGVSILFFTRDLLLDRTNSVRIDWKNSLIENAFCYLWAIFTPLVLWVANLFPIERPVVVKNGALHLLFSVIVILAVSTIYFVIRFATGLDPELHIAMQIRRSFGTAMVLDALVYWSILGSVVLYRYSMERNRQLLAMEEMRADLAKTRLNLLNRSIQPHFLFNTLNSVSEIMHENLCKARKTIHNMEEFLKHTTIENIPQMVALQHELELLKQYLDIQEVRFEDQLQVRIEIPPEHRSICVPYLILQPIVENSIRHGRNPRTLKCEIEIHSSIEANQLCIEIQDHGPGINGNFQEGFGLITTRKRLRAIYSCNSDLVIRNHQAGGLYVKLSLPIV